MSRIPGINRISEIRDQGSQKARNSERLFFISVAFDSETYLYNKHRGNKYRALECMGFK